MRKIPAGFDSVQFGRRLRTTREEQHLTREHFAELCDISVIHLRGIERGDAIPSMSLFVLMCNTLNVLPNYLLQDSVEALKSGSYDSIKAMLDGASPAQTRMIEAIVRAAIEQLEQES